MKIGIGNDRHGVDVKKSLTKYLIDKGYTKRDAIKKISNDYNISKNMIYNPVRGAGYRFPGQFGIIAQLG